MPPAPAVPLPPPPSMAPPVPPPPELAVVDVEPRRGSNASQSKVHVAMAATASTHAIFDRSGAVVDLALIVDHESEGRSLDFDRGHRLLRRAREDDDECFTLV